jgi:hypothetical protein
MVVPKKRIRANRRLQSPGAGAALLAAAFTLACWNPRLLRALETQDRVAPHESKSATKGPLRVCQTNPRYFCDRSDKVVMRLLRIGLGTFSLRGNPKR